MTDGGHIPNEGLPEHLLPETGTDPVQGGGGWGGDLVGQAVPVGVPGPGYTFIDEPDRVDPLEDEDDVLLMPGPQGSWSDVATSPVVPLGEALAPQGTPGYPVYATVDGSMAFPRRTFRPRRSRRLPSPPRWSRSRSRRPCRPRWCPRPWRRPPSRRSPPSPAWRRSSRSSRSPRPCRPPLRSRAVSRVGRRAGGALLAAARPAAADRCRGAAPVVAQPEQAAAASAAAAQPQVSQPVGGPARRPLHAGPPIPDPSVMTGQVPVRSLADRGPPSRAAPRRTASRSPPRCRSPLSWQPCPRRSSRSPRPW